MNNIKKLLGIVSGVFLMSSVYAQDVNFTQPYSAILQVNPALMATNQNLNVTLGYKSQWSSIDDGYKTYRASAMSPLLWKKGGKLDLGLMYTGDQAGAFTTNDIQLALSYDLKIEKKHHLAVSLSGGYVNKGLDETSLIFDDQYIHGEYTSENLSSEILTGENVSFVDASFGVLWHYTSKSDSLSTFFGVSGYHFYAPRESYVSNSEAELQARYNFVGGVRYSTGVNIDVSPNVISVMQGGSLVTYFGLYLDYKLNIGGSASNSTAMVNGSGDENPGETKTAPAKNSQITLGAWYNNQSKALALIFGVKYDKFALGYSYGFANSALRETSAFARSTHEITLSFLMNRTGNKSLSPIGIW